MFSQEQSWAHTLSYSSPKTKKELCTAQVLVPEYIADYSCSPLHLDFVRFTATHSFFVFCIDLFFGIYPFRPLFPIPAFSFRSPLLSPLIPPFEPSNPSFWAL